MAKKTVARQCINCNIDFNANYYDTLKGMGLYCSKKCHIEFKKKQNLINGVLVTKVCKECNKEFITNRGEISKGGGKYCSTICANKGNTGVNNVKYKPKLSITCEECGEAFSIHSCHKSRTKYCSRRCAGLNKYKIKLQSFNTGKQRGKGGKRSDLDNMYFRSSWEANYARYLNFLVLHNKIIRWEYEVDTFEFINIKRGTKFYTPDFKVYNTNGTIEYHEVKGWMDQKSKTRMKRMAKYYPNIKVLIIDKIWFRKNGKNLQNLIPNWETKVY